VALRQAPTRPRGGCRWPQQNDRDRERLDQVHRVAAATVPTGWRGDRWEVGLVAGRPGNSGSERDLHADACRPRPQRIRLAAQLDGDGRADAGSSPIDYGRDDYNLPTSMRCRIRSSDLYTLDVNYALSESWNLKRFLSTGSQKINQARPGGYILAFDETSFNAGVGFDGKVARRCAWRLAGVGQQ